VREDLGGPVHPLTAAARRYRDALGGSGYRRLWAAAVLSRTGDILYFVALPLFVYGQTHAPTAVAAVVVAEGAGLIGGGIVAQIWVDRVPPRRLLILMDLVRATAATALAAVPSFPSAIVVSLVLSGATAIFAPASGSLIPRLVPDDALEAANGLQWAAGVTLQLLAAPVAGWLVVQFSARVPFGVDAASFLVSAAVLLGLPNLPALGGAAPSSWLQARQSLDLLRTTSTVRTLMAMQAVAALGAGATSALLVVLATSAYGLNGAGYGLWLAAIGAGALVGPVLVPTIRRIPNARWVSLAYLIRGAGDIALGLLRSGVAGAGFLALYGVNTSSGMVAFQTLVQRAVSPQLRGRAFALLDVTWQSGRLLSIAAGGVIASVIGIRGLFLIGGALLIAAGMVGLARLRAEGPIAGA
jgi:predicted MFS family arabinose efflux permease